MVIVQYEKNIRGEFKMVIKEDPELTSSCGHSLQLHKEKFSLKQP